MSDRGNMLSGCAVFISAFALSCLLTYAGIKTAIKVAEASELIDRIATIESRLSALEEAK